MITNRAETVGEAIDAILTHLAAESIPHSLDDTGGGSLCVRVDLTGGAWIWVSDDEGSLVTRRYEDNDDIGESLAYGGTLDDMTRVIRTHLPDRPAFSQARGIMSCLAGRMSVARSTDRVQYADLRTSMDDARTALVIAMGVPLANIDPRRGYNLTRRRSTI